MSKATHIAAGEMYYDYLGNDDYQINLLLYRDCSGVGYDEEIRFTVFDQYDVVVQEVSMFIDTSNIEQVDYSTIITPVCLAQFSGACLEYYTYSTVVNLPPITGGYTISYQRCCLTGQIVNIESSDYWGYTFTCKIPGLETGYYENSSPRFLDHSLFLACTNELINFDHEAFDPDGDSLVYSLITPFGFEYAFGGLPDPNPDPEFPPPYPSMYYDTSFSAQSPIGVGATLAIDSMTGTMSVQPVSVGQFAIGVKVDEYKSDTLINSTFRNLNMQVATGNLGSEENMIDDKFWVSPNPAVDFVKVNSKVAHLLIVSSADGKNLLFRDCAKHEEYRVNTANFEPGVYYFRFVTSLESVVYRILK